MKFRDKIKALGEKVNQSLESTTTEEALKTAFVLPFISALGYDIFDPTEVIPEFVTDYGTKKGEKVDYCIKKDNSPIIIIECKHWKEDLNNHNSQLFRYFTVTDVRFAILTNGRIYRFYTDSEYPNRMDDKPFWEFDISNLKDNDIENLKKYNKDNFDTDKMFRNAVDLKYSEKIKKILRREIEKPSDEFIKFFAKRIHNGTVSKKIVEKFRVIVKKSLNNFITEKKADSSYNSIIESNNIKISENKKVHKIANDAKYIIMNGEQFPIKYSYEILVTTAEWLIKKGHINRQECPLFFSKRRNLIHYEPIHQNHKKFFAPRKLSNGLYIETHASKNQLINLSKKLLGQYNYSEEILEIIDG